MRKIHLAAIYSVIEDWGQREPARKAEESRQTSGTVEATVFHKTVDYPDEYSHRFQVTLDDGIWVTVWQDQVRQAPNYGKFRA